MEKKDNNGTEWSSGVQRRQFVEPLCGCKRKVYFTHLQIDRWMNETTTTTQYGVQMEQVEKEEEKSGYEEMLCFDAQVQQAKALKLTDKKKTEKKKTKMEEHLVFIIFRIQLF